MGTRAFSHDSIFIPDGQAEEEQEAQTSSQDCVVGKVKSLQQQLGKNIRFGQPPPTSIAGKRMSSGAAIEEMETTQHSPVEVSAERDSSLINDGNRTMKSPSSQSPRYVPEPEHKPEEKVTPVKTSRPKRPSGTIETINLDAVPQSVTRLDNSAAKHKLSVKPKNQRVSKKHRGMSQDFDTIEDNENESTSNMQKNKAMYHSMDISSYDTYTPDHFQRNISDHFRSLVSEGDNKLKKNLEGKYQDHSNLKQAEEDTKRPDEEKKSEADKRKEEEDKKRQEIIRNIELERLKQKLKEEKENELKEQRRREEERKQRAEQILKELEEYRRQEEQKQHEQEEKKTLQLAEEQKKRELEIQRALQVAEEMRKQEMERQRSLQLAEEQKKREVEQKAIQTADEKKKPEVEKQKVPQTAEDQNKTELGRQRAPQITEASKYELEEWEMLKTAEEMKNEELEEPKAKEQKYEMKQQRSPKTVEQRKNEQELIRTNNISEEQKREQLDLGKSDQQQTNELEKYRTEEREIRGQEEAKSCQFTEEQQLQTPEGQTQIKIGGIKNELTYEELNKTEQKALQKSGQQAAGDIKSHVLQEHHFPIDQEAVSAEIELCQNQTPQEKLKTNEELSQEQQKEAECEKQERINEERRWEELDKRQKSYTFKVGEKQIIFEKVNLSPVTVSKDPVISPGAQDPKDNKVNNSSHNLPSTQCIPHTAILVTGAQLCGTAVNPDEIKDTACKSLLGLTEERKLDIAEDKTEKEKKQISSKTKYSSEALDSQSFLAEWNHIRSKILNKTENVIVNEKNKSGSLTPTEDLPATGKSESHSSLRKTMSANAKFSITPAWQKFPEPGKTPEINVESSMKPSSKENIAVLPDKTQGKAGDRALIVQEMVSRIKKQVTIDGNAEGWIFSKDLPSFIVPNPPQSPRRGFLETQMSLETQLSNGALKADKLLQGTEEKIPPFGIKLRRTNYSLRFHADTQSEQKKKKRYSAGDSFEGIPTPFISADETESRTIAKKEASDSSDKVKKDNTTKVLPDTSKSASDIVQGSVSPLVPSSSPQVSSPNRDRGVPKSPVIHKPSLAPKPASPTPPSSPLSQLSKTNLNDLHRQWLDRSEKGKQTAGEVNATLSSPSHVKGLQQDVKEKPDLSSVSWREKPDKSVKDRPVIQSRHSLDSSRLIDQVETAQPLWITLALQKQKGFREQQATREERRQAREAKQADRLTKENVSSVQPGEYRSRSGSLPKPSPQEEKKADTVVTRLQRREQLQKSNTLPTSVTVEITETVPVALARDLTKRFSTPDATPASSEPTWLALAKRKSKAWSDCPQIIK
ncbi:capping protein-inhibiting regulator of actin dynamics [Hyperolius riggenbachi]|uniref:capping protein-inhibiting regulator of actin dynamics n=1 Tax=Hyperolius riggenbachi TaxID=752182 RepID=UPI0035A3A4E0